ncbi:MAG: hypothetical protein Q9180_000368 [Flavoplaca navasiana]
MAEAAAPNTPSDASSITTSQASHIPSTVSSTGNPHSAGFLKPDSPRKRRRSGEKSEPIPTSPKFCVSPPTLSAAQALIDQRRQRRAQETILDRETSPNPAIAVISALQGKQMVSDKDRENVAKSPSGGAGTSEPMDAAAPSAQKPEASQVGVAPTQRSLTPSSSSGLAPGQEVLTPAMIEGSGISVASPARTEEVTGNDETIPAGRDAHQPRRQETDPGEGRSDKALTYPGPLPNFQQSDRRRNTHAGFGRESPLKSPGSNKKHQYTPNFTRGRDRIRAPSVIVPLPGAMRWRGIRKVLEVALDGDRAWEVTIQNRKRLVYTGEASHEPEKMDGEADVGASRKGSLPSIQRHEAPNYSGSDSHATYIARQPSTYPPIVGRQPNPGGLYPPMASPGAGSSSSNSPRQTTFSQSTGGTTFPPSAANQTVFSQGGGMTESPKPLSPGSHQLGHPEPSIHGNRSPSVTQHYQQQHLGRKSSMQNTSSAMSLPPIPPSGHPGAPHLPSLPGLPPPDLRFTLHSQAGGPSPVHPSAQGSGPTAASPSYQSPSGNNSLSSQSGDGSQKLYGSEQTQIFAYIRSLEVKIDRLQEEVGTLKSQLSASR